MRKLVLIVLALSLMVTPAYAIGDVERGIIYGAAGILGLQHLSNHLQNRHQEPVRYYNWHHRDRFRTHWNEDVIHGECIWVAQRNRHTGEIDRYDRFCR